MFHNGVLRRWLGALVAGAAVAALTVGTAGADDSSKILEEMKARLDKLEKQNDELKKKLSDGAAKPATPASDGKADKDKIKKEIDDYLKEVEKKKKEDDEKKAAEKAEAGFNTESLPRAIKAEWLGAGAANTNYGTLWFSSDDNAFRFHIGGWVDMDYVGVDSAQRETGPLANQGIGKFDDGVNVRRVRWRMEGTMYDQYDFLLEFDYSLAQRVAMQGGGVTLTSAGATTGTINSTSGTIADRGQLISVIVPTDMWGQIRNTPIGNVRIGNCKPLYSMEQLQSSRFIDYLEFSYIWDAFLEQGNNGWIPSIVLWDNFDNRRGFWGVGAGVSNNKNLFFWNEGDGEWEQTARAGYTFLDENEGRNLLNISVGSMHQTSNDGSLRYRARFDLRNGNNVEQPSLAAIGGGLSDAFLIQPELFFNWGAFNIMSEWAFMAVAQNSGATFNQVGNQTSGLPTGGRGELYYTGGYVSLGYFLTGESRAFDRTWKTPDRQIPIQNAFSFRDGSGHWNLTGGAWEVLARYNYLDMDSKGVNGGIVHGLTLGLNWYLNPNFRFMFNAVADYRDAVQYSSGVPASPSNVQNGWLYGVGGRIHFDF
jgi:phosphate-selective porin OprO/OprP